jgi:hypothetical protein
VHYTSPHPNITTSNHHSIKRPRGAGIPSLCIAPYHIPASQHQIITASKRPHGAGIPSLCITHYTIPTSQHQIITASKDLVVQK